MPVIPLVSSDSPTLISSAPFVRTSFGARSFSVAAPKIWNSLPLSLRIRSYLLCTSHDTFRLHLKTHYCQQAFQSTQPLLSCASRSAFADHCARLEIIFTYLLTYWSHMVVAPMPWRREKVVRVCRARLGVLDSGITQLSSDSVRRRTRYQDRGNRTASSCAPWQQQQQQQPQQILQSWLIDSARLVSIVGRFERLYCCLD